MHIYQIIVSKFLKDCNERFQTVFFIFCSILVFCKRNSKCYSNRSEKPINMESPWNVLKIYVSKALGLLNKNLVILGAPKQRNCLLPTSKVCFQVHDSESHKPAFSATSLNCSSLNLLHPLAPSNRLHPLAPSNLLHPLAPSKILHPLAPFN